MKKLIFLLLPLALLSLIPGQRSRHEFENGMVKCSYETNRMRIDGPYISYYKNGQKKSEGQFENNYRTGKWSVWDSTGRLRVQRIYENPFVFKAIVPAAPSDKPVALLNIPRYYPEYNAKGYIDYFNLKERMVVWATRIWRFIPESNNELLFEKDRLFNLLQKNMLLKNITPYKDDEYRTELTADAISSKDMKVIGYRIKEDSFFDNDRFVSETRIIGICPVMQNTLTQDTIDLYWIYMPELREYLAQEKIQSKGFPAKVKSLDDLFFYRCFSGIICKESNIFDRKISDYKTEKQSILKEAERIGIGMIETEHDLWISFTQ
jgi:hypothetical protein